MPPAPHLSMNTGTSSSVSGLISATVRRGTMFGWRCLRHPTWAQAHLRSWLSNDLVNYFDTPVPTVSVEAALHRLTGRSADVVAGALATMPRPALQRPSINPVTDDGSTELIRLVYGLCLLARPVRVVETGVSNGTTTAVILEALSKVAKEGRLLSIDLPWLHPCAANSVGAMVPEKMMPLWTLRLGAADRLLRAAETDWAPVDIFVQDASHAYSGQLREYRAGWRLLRAGGVLISDDVGKALAAFGHEVGVDPLYVGQAKDRPIGVLVKSS